MSTENKNIEKPALVDDEISPASPAKAISFWADYPIIPLFLIIARGTLCLVLLFFIDRKTACDPSSVFNAFVENMCQIAYLEIGAFFIGMALIEVMISLKGIGRQEAIDHMNLALIFFSLMGWIGHGVAAARHLYNTLNCQ